MTQQGTSNGGQQWAYNAGDEGAVGTGGGSNGYGGVEGVRRQPPLHRTMSEEVQQQLGRTLGLQAGSSGTPSYGFQPMDHARLSPSAFDPSNFSSQFVMPRFASGPSDPFGFGVGVMDPPTSSREGISPMPFDWSAFTGGNTPGAEQSSQPSPFQPAAYPPPTPSTSNHLPPQQYMPVQQQREAQHPYEHQRQAIASSVGSSNYISQTPSTGQSSSSSYNPSPGTYNPPASHTALAQSFPSAGPSGTIIAPHQSELESPIYAPYGSSVISVNPTPNTAYKLPPLAVNLPPSQAGPTSFDPSALGLPAPPVRGQSNNFAGLYSASGFDMLGVLARVAARPNPQIQIGPVDNSCAFAVVDARRWDQPLVFVSDTFVKMTGYTNEEIIGRNCRFLQTPGGGTMQGQPRKYTDGNAAWHMRQHIQSGKESQSSLINYTKEGRPFINLVTIIPICWDTEEVAYFVGFQVDLVDQPNAILNRMSSGQYVINYSLTGQRYMNEISRNPSISDDSGQTVSMKTIENVRTGHGGLAGSHAEPDEWSMLELMDDAQPDIIDSPPVQPTPRHPAAASASTAASTAAAVSALRASQPQKLSAAEQMAGAGGEPSGKTATELLDLVAQRGVGCLNLEVDRRAFHQLLLGEADDFVHVLSLKGSLLYCSPSVSRVLEYEPGELVGTTLSALCHPSDVVPVLRQLKDASSIQTPFVKLLYRIRRKYSGFVWVEAVGKLHIEPGKGRKCVIVVGRSRDTAQMNWSDLRKAGGLGDTEFFFKLGGPRGTILQSTPEVQSVLGFVPQEMVGCTLLDLVEPEYRQQLQIAIQQAELGVPASVQYKIRNRKGAYLQVVTRFYPHQPEIPDAAVPSTIRLPAIHTTIVAQTNELSSEQRKINSLFATVPPAYVSDGRSPAVSDAASTESNEEGSGASKGSPAAFQSTFKTLSHPSTTSENVFDELETRRPTSWQFELHQLQNMNKRLRDEKEHLMSLRPRRAPSSRGSMSRKGSMSVISSLSDVNRVCQNCGRTDSPEWRAGPNGSKTLCNACGLRWAKQQKQAPAGTVATLSHSPADESPTSSTYSTLANLAPLSISPSLQQTPQQQSFSLPKVEEDGYIGDEMWQQ